MDADSAEGCGVGDGDVEEIDQKILLGEIGFIAHEAKHLAPDSRPFDWIGFEAHGA